MNCTILYCSALYKSSSDALPQDKRLEETVEEILRPDIVKF